MLSRRTLVLWGLVAVLAVLDLWPRSQEDARADLPVLPAVPAESIREIRITRLIDPPIRIARQADGGWRLLEPIEAEADGEVVERLVKRFAKPLRMDARVDRDNLDQYGLDDGNRVLFEIDDGGPEPVVSLYVGFDLPGGVSFVKLRGDPFVYRARLGGRALYDRPADDWRSRQVLGLDPEAVVAVEIEGPQGRLAFERPPGPPGPDGAPTPGRWRLVDDPGFDLDGRTVSALVTRLARMRAGEVLAPSFDGGFANPAARVRLVAADGSATVVVFGSRSDARKAWVRVEGREPVYRVAASLLRAVSRPLPDYRNLQVLRLDASAIRSLRIEDAEAPTEIARNADGSWVAVAPAHLDVDPAAVRRALAILADLRAHRVADVDPADAGLDRPAARIVVATGEGSTTLRIGAEVPGVEGRPRRYLQVAGRPRVYEVRVDTLRPVLAALGRAG